jgi:hypothetical protein
MMIEQGTVEKINMINSEEILLTGTGDLYLY